MLLGTDFKTLSVPAGAEFTDALLKAMRGDKDVVQCAYVESPLFADKGATFFASKVTLGVRSFSIALDSSSPC